MAILLKSGTLGVNIGNTGGYADYKVYDDGKVVFAFRDGGWISWDAGTAVPGIMVEYGGKEIPAAYSAYGKTITFEYKRARNTMKFWGMLNGSIAGQVSEDSIPDESDLMTAPTSVSIEWEIPNASPTATLSATTPFAGKANKISWRFSDADGDSVSLVRLVRYYKAANASSYSGTTILSSSSAGSYNDTIPSTYGGGSVYYEIFFEDTYGGSGTAKTAAVKVLSNSAPTIPGIPVLPEVISGGADITVTWGKSTDADGNLEGYKLERSIDGGGSWTQVYQGAVNSAVTPVPSGIDSVMYRVKAYDSYGEESGYASTAEHTVINNTAPTAPAKITVPAVVANGSAVLITWAVSADADGETITYQLERSSDSGEFEVIYSGSARNYRDFIAADWRTVAYRVCALDERGAKSDYAVSDVRNIISNYGPTAEIVDAPDGNDYGMVSDAFPFSVKIGDEDDESLGVDIYVDGVHKETRLITLGFGTSSDVVDFNFAAGLNTEDYWYTIPNGRHTLTVKVSDSKSYTTAELYFTKLVKDAVITLAEPMTSSEQIKVCIISVGGEIPDDADLTVEVTNNGNDASPVWEDATAHALSGMNHAFANSTQTNGWAFNFRVTVHGGDTRGYITSIQGGFQ